jgi:hypothetical protein
VKAVFNAAAVPGDHDRSYCGGDLAIKPVAVIATV